MIWPTVSVAEKLKPTLKRLFIGAYGFERRSLGWVSYQREQGTILSESVLFRYKHPKGINLIHELKKNLGTLGVSKPKEVPYNVRSPHNIEDIIGEKMDSVLRGNEEIVVDISAMTKLLILACLCKLANFTGTVRIVYSEAEDYSPTQEDYEKSKDVMGMVVEFPSRGFESIIRLKCLSSIRMQGQPVTIVAFTSFNEQLIRHILGTISPHRLLFINGRPPKEENSWREKATQEIHQRLIEKYPADNLLNDKGLLMRAASTLDYRETVERINEIYKQYGIIERIICVATGSKMQTVGLFFSKIAHPDIHVEYPTPDSYYVKGMSKGVHKVHEVVVPQFSEFLKIIRKSDSVITAPV